MQRPDQHDHHPAPANRCRPTRASGRRAAAIAASLLVAACGSGGDSSEPADASAPPPSSGPAPSATARIEWSPTTESTVTTDATQLPISSTSVATATSAPTTDRVAEPGLAWTTVEIIDESRPTDEVLGSDGAVVLAAAPTRTIPTVVVYPGADGGGEDVAPADADPRPLAVWVNGPGGRAAAGDPLLLALYEAGYVVVAPNGPEVSAPVSAFGGYVNMPGDVSATIDSILDPSDGVADDLAALIDPDRIGVAGHSLGGAGAYAVGYHDCCRDERVSAVAGFAPPLASFGGGDFRFDAPLPLLVIHGTADALTTVEQVESVGRVAADALLVSIADADHFEPVYGNDRPEVVEATGRLLTTFFDVHVAGSAAAADIDAELGQASDLASVLEVADPES